MRYNNIIYHIYYPRGPCINKLTKSKYDDIFLSCVILLLLKFKCQDVLSISIVVQKLFSYMLSNEILRFLNEIEIDITTGGH